MNKHCLFVGGPADGQWKTVPLELTIIRLEYCDKDVDDFLDSPIEIHTYRQERLCASFNTDYAYFHTSIPMSELMRVLINGYAHKPNENTNRKTKANQAS